ncbi:MAG TPA: DUF1579 family protein [Terriglobales bacterium]|nr:DUF1579 family protein [Terriglobales bacterium]
MRRTLLAFGFAITTVLISTQLYAQMGPPPTPAPELKKLDFLTGDWAAEGTMTAGPPGTPATKWNMNTHAEWMEGNFFLVEHDDADMGTMGKSTELAVLGYDSEKKVYTYTAFSSMGEAESSTGTIDGDTWTWLSNEHFGGMPMKGRYTMKVLSPTSYAMKFELSQDGTNWTTAMEGKATKK